MRSLFLSLLWIGVSAHAFAQPPDHATAASTHARAPAPRSPVGEAMASLARALHDAAEQARQPTATATPQSATLAGPAPTPAPATAQTAPPQATAQAALP